MNAYHSKQTHYIRVSLIVFIMLLLGACSSSKSNIDYDVNTDFNAINSFQFSSSTKVTNLALDDLTEQRVKNAIADELANKALLESSDGADVQVSFFLSEQQKENNSSFSIGLGGSTGGRVSTGIGLGTTFPIGDRVDTLTNLTIEFYRNGKLIWRGFDELDFGKNASPDKRTEAINKTVANILTKYPPS
ncbi:DUF4136 domain-containing protein [Thalassotalea ponticola]|uniref:DUF4136 domain-containing protein n=1 Tax=Thalassotalea ponticola TaxID=1523392 RepID=UPI0025B30298|nr:DUF4136 domain-containing protein [Thalassotalea ponticola]MDN3652176.1 DUF4136 domain-containing protein [Thalassotalea ponticola]